MYQLEKKKKKTERKKTPFGTQILTEYRVGSLLDHLL